MTRDPWRLRVVSAVAAQRDQDDANEDSRPRDEDRARQRFAEHDAAEHDGDERVHVGVGGAASGRGDLRRPRIRGEADNRTQQREIGERDRGGGGGKER